jgi:hypothetical protein
MAQVHTFALMFGALGSCSEKLSSDKKGKRSWTLSNLFD